jgi:hypothetical protein
VTATRTATGCIWCATPTRGRPECSACRRGTRRLAGELWDPAAVRELEWDAALAWSPLWTLVPEPVPTTADVEYAAAQRKALAERLAREARWREEARHRAAEHAKSAAIRARAEMDFSRYRGQLGSAPTASEIGSVPEALAGMQPRATTEADVRAARAAGPPMMEPPPGTRVFRHAIAKSGLTCVTEMGALRCDCGFYRMTWTEAEAR